MQCATCNQQNSPDARNCSVCGSPLDVRLNNFYSPALSSGIQLCNGIYEINNELGQGGFGITYRGYDHSLRRFVAIKEFFPEGSIRQDKKVVPDRKINPAEYIKIKEKFIQEAYCLAQFSHPGIVRVYGVFEENNTAYMVMELLEGHSLEQHVSVKGHLGEQEVIDIATKVSEALSVVHQAGLIHRDIKPDNIMLAKDGRVVLIDFGTARAFDLNKTVNHTAMLTHGYAPLEQYGSRARFGAFTDIYALGATLYRALSGEFPPPATDFAAGVELKSLCDINPQISQATSNAISRAMEVKSADRPQSVQEFITSFKKSIPHSTSVPITDKQLQDAKARTEENIEKWKNIIASVRKAEEMSGVKLPIDSYLVERSQVVKIQLDDIEYSSIILIEKEAISSYSKIVSDVRAELWGNINECKSELARINREIIDIERSMIEARNNANLECSRVKINNVEEFSIWGSIVLGAFVFGITFIVLCMAIIVVNGVVGLKLSNMDAQKIAFTLSFLFGLVPIIAGVVEGIRYVKRKESLREERAILIENAENECEGKLKKIENQFGPRLSSLKNEMQDFEQKSIAAIKCLKILNF
ncbi:serine/threonine protein kinase [bacterium]|nr:MAG: serine/threonine protein kinase [bacterium]